MLSGFPQAQKTLLKELPVNLGVRQVWEQAERVGADLVRRRNGEVNAMLQGRGPSPPANLPDLLVVSPDNGRLQDRRRAPGERWCEYKEAVVYRAAREEGARTGLGRDPQPRPHWKYTASCVRVDLPNKTYHDPEPEVKTFVATTEKIDRFPLLVDLEARRRGLMEADTVAVIGDGGEFVWRTAKEVCEARRAGGKRVFEILDIIHASSHLVDAAKAAFAPSKERAEWLNARLGEIWSGDAEDLVKALEAKAAELGPRPERKKPGTLQPGTGGAARGSVPSKDRTERGCKLPGEGAKGGDEADPVKVAWNARDYFDDNRERIRYDVFRRHGLPMSSSHIESGIKQTNRRVKGTEKAWYLEHAEEMLALRTFALSEDGRWDDYFDRLREGSIELQTRGRMKPVPLFPDKRKTPTRKAS